MRFVNGDESIPTHLKLYNAQQFNMKQITQKMGTVSIIIPIYNALNYIEECLSSVFRQTYPHIEIIVIDDASTDNSAELVENILKKSPFPFCLIKQNENRGVSVARNTGINKAEGEYIYLLDADDYIDDHCIECFVSIAKRDMCDMVFARHKDISADGSVISEYKKLNDTIFDNPFLAHVQDKLTTMAGNRFVRRDFLLSSGVKFKENTRYEDNIWSFSLAIKAKKVSTTGTVTYYYRMHNDSFTSSSKYDSKKLDYLYYMMQCYEQVSSEIKPSNLYHYHIWYARNILDILEKIIVHEQDPYQRAIRFKCIFQKLTIPHQELNTLTHNMYRFCKAFAIFFKNYQWIVPLIYIRKWKRSIAHFIQHK